MTYLFIQKLIKSNLGTSFRCQLFLEVPCRGYTIKSHPATVLPQVVKTCRCPQSKATTFFRGSNTANFRIRRPSLAPFTHKLSDWPDKSHTETSYYCTYGMSYSNALFLAGLTSLKARREQLARNLFDSITEPRSCLHHLLPPPRDPKLLSRLRAPTKYPRTTNRTKKYQSFISFALNNYQTS